jgi:anti-sigma factor RsiW
MPKKDDEKNKDLLHRALDGEVNKTETRHLQAKLEADGKMRAEFEQLKKVVKETTRVRMDVPTDFTRKVLDETRRMRKPKP